MSKQTPRNRRQDLLAAFAKLVNENGVRAATLEAVAKAANVSKGGLLYHFPAKEALIEGLCELFAQQVDEDLEQMRETGYGPTKWYLHTSTHFDSPLETTMSALMRLAPMNEATLRPALMAARECWFELIADELGDRRLATAVVLLGDGIAYNSELEGQSGDGEFASVDMHRYLLQLVQTQRASDVKTH